MSVCLSVCLNSGFINIAFHPSHFEKHQQYPATTCLHRTDKISARAVDVKTLNETEWRPAVLPTNNGREIDSGQIRSPSGD